MLGHRAWTSRAKFMPSQAARHLNIGKQQANAFVSFEDLERGRRVLSFEDLESVLFKEASGINPQKLFVVDHNGQGRRRFLHQAQRDILTKVS